MLEKCITESDALRRLVDEARDVADHEALLLLPRLFFFLYGFLDRRPIQYRVELAVGEGVDALSC